MLKKTFLFDSEFLFQKKKSYREGPLNVAQGINLFLYKKLETFHTTQPLILH